MTKFSEFIFKNYEFKDKKLLLVYSYDNQVDFAERYSFDFKFTDNLDEELLDQACQLVFFMAGVSYYKAYLPPKIRVQKGQIDDALAGFLSRTYQKGLGEFFYVNKLSPNTPVIFPVNSPVLETKQNKDLSGMLIGIGGGKDSLVSVELLRGQPKVGTWSVGHHEQLEPLVQKIGLPHFWVERELDKSLLEHNKQGAYNGHIPVSAILACIGSLVSVLSGHRDVVVSNESSASEPNLTYQGVAINHQYSKSIEFEKDFQQLIKGLSGSSPRYYSLLRPFSELRISELFVKSGFEKYKNVFCSCNRAFLQSSTSIFWCGECPKCAFVFLALTPFVSRQELEVLFGKNLLLDPSLEQTYRQLLGIEGNKPLDCVGEVKESRTAMRLAQEQYPELDKYKFEIPEDYDFRASAPHSMPPGIFEILKSKILSD